MRPYPLTVLNGGINRLRVKGGASASQLYDLTNAYITNAGSIVPREGTLRFASLTSQTTGLAAANGTFNIFAPFSSLAPPVQNAIVGTTTGGDGSFVSGTTYYFEVTANDPSGNETSVSNEQLILATGTHFSATISWLQVPGAASYNVYFSSASGTEANWFNSIVGGYSFLTTRTSLYTGHAAPVTNGTIVSVPAGFTLNILSDPHDRTQALEKIWFAKPFMGFEYVVAQFANNDVVHYWLQNDGTWTSTTDYTTASIVLPPVLNGLAYQAVRYFPPQPLWTPETAITPGQYVEPNSPTGFAYQAVNVPGSFTGVLYHFDGNFNDSSGNNLTALPQNSATTTSTPVEFGTGALDISGATPYTITSITTGSPIDIGLTDFTVEFWLYVPVVSAGYVFSIGGATSGIYKIIFSSATTTISIGSNSALTTGTNTTGQWNAIAMSVIGTTGYAFINGSLLGTFSAPLESSFGGSVVAIGQDPAQSGSHCKCYIDEFRITKGTGLYNANYTVSTTAFAGVSGAGAIAAHTGATEPVWPTVAGGIIQEFGDFDSTSSVAGSTQGSGLSTAASLAPSITDRYGDSNTISNAGIFVTGNSALSTLTLASTKITTWQAGKTYPTGSVVVPTTNQGGFINAIPNGDFESGNVDWTFTDVGGAGQWAIGTTRPFQGTYDVEIAGGTSFGADGAYATMTTGIAVTPGQSVTLTGQLDPNNNGSDLELWLVLRWYDSTDTFISNTLSAAYEGGGYRPASVTGIAPANAATVKAAVRAGAGTTSRNMGFADLLKWNLEVPTAVTNFLYEAVQPASGVSAGTQPTWPTVIGNEVIDNTVTWLAIGTSIITWEAIPLMQSGLTTPAFPTTIGASVYDSSTFTNQNGVITTFPSMGWQAVDRSVTDTGNPQTLAVTIGASHVFAGDNDIVDYSAAVNPIDWTSTNNAGYLPTGLNNYGDNPVTAVALYRGNLIVFNAGGYQMWQIDPDPQNMAFLDAQPVGCIWTRSAQSVANDLIFLTEVGVRNLGTIGATANMAIGNTGQPIDPLVLAQINSATYDPFTIYFPGRGQYWLIYGPQVFVLTINGLQGTKSWSRYIFPQALTDATLNSGSLFLRTTGSLVWQLNTLAVGDDQYTIVCESPVSLPIISTIQWPYLDMGGLGLNKMLIGLDLVGNGAVTIQIAYNQTDASTFNDNVNFATSTGVTTPYLLNIEDTVPGEPLPFPINAPSYSLILTFNGGTITTPTPWDWEAANFYLAPQGGGGVTG